MSSSIFSQIVSYCIIRQGQRARNGNFMRRNILSLATGVSICRDSPPADLHIPEYEHRMWGKRYYHLWPGVKQHLAKFSFCLFRSSPIITYRPTQPAMLPSGQSQVFIGSSRCSRSCMASTSPPAITSLFALSGTVECMHWLEKAENTWTACQKSKVESWKSKVEVQCWVETNFDSKHSFSPPNPKLMQLDLNIYYHLSENNEKYWIETIMLAFILWLKSKSYATRPMLSPQCGPLWTTYSNSAAPFSNISIKCG